MSSARTVWKVEAPKFARFFGTAVRDIRRYSGKVMTSSQMVLSAWLANSRRFETSDSVSIFEMSFSTTGSRS